MRVARAAARNVRGLVRFMLAVRQFHARPATDPIMALSALREAWGNLGFAAEASYLCAVLQFARESPGAILECGSGLTTLLLAFTVPQMTSSLEHLETWRRHVQTRLWWAGGCAKILRAPLRRYGAFDWYDLPADLPREFSLVICDGPPGETMGGRYGLLPVVGERLRKGAIILMDDAHRPNELTVLERWKQEAGWQYTIHGNARQAYAVVTV
jgi:Methyltransferase domain